MARYTDQSAASAVVRAPALPRRALLFQVPSSRPTPPGQHGVRRRKVATAQLREKQKVRRVYSVLERQFKNYRHRRLVGRHRRELCGCSSCGSTASSAGWASRSRAAARQLATHGHFCVNGGPRASRVPAQVGRPGRGSESRELEPFKVAKETLRSHQPRVADIDAAKLAGTILGQPRRDQRRSISTTLVMSTTRGAPDSRTEARRSSPWRSSAPT